MHLLLIQLYLNRSESSKVLFTNTKSKLSLCSQDGVKIYGCTDKNSIIKAVIRHEDNGKIFIEVPKYKKVFDVAGNGTKLILYKKHGGTNQVFNIVFFDYEKYTIRNNEKCFGYDTEKDIFMKSPCSEDGSIFKLTFDYVENEKLISSKKQPAIVVEEYWAHKSENNVRGIPKLGKRNYIPMDK
ncbi:ricin B lectin (RBL4b) [Vairimorpha necatrix]|uniref:Ricin B lectin (RBL4b) n=1 Tax=Vairimorpha necatrix TaxID=6039 RepID=A0AAX4JAY5_9MICR